MERESTTPKILQVPKGLQESSSHSLLPQEPGHLNCVNIKEYKSLSDLTWKNIPRLALITGKNGSGKTHLLEAIIKGYNDILSGEKSKEINLEFRNGIHREDLPEICTLRDIGQPIEKLKGGLEAMGGVDKRSNEKHTDKLKLKKERFEEFYHSQAIGSDSNPCQDEDEKREFGDIIEKIKQSKQKISRASDFLSLCKDEITRSSALHVSVMGDPEEFCKEMIHNRGVEIKNINDLLQNNKFKYVIADAGTHAAFNLDFQTEKGVGDEYTVRYKDLSPGEKFEFWAILWSLRDKRKTKNALLILDEPDAHFHPSLVKKFIDSIQNRLVAELNFQVIMTTHSPTTVSMVERQNLFILEGGQIRPATVKREAIRSLTSHFVHVNSPFLLVFVEGLSDSQFYKMIEQNIADTGNLKYSYPIHFKAHSAGKKSSLSNCKNVKVFVQKMLNIPTIEFLWQKVCLQSTRNTHFFKIKRWISEALEWKLEDVSFKELFSDGVLLCEYKVSANFHPFHKN